MPWGNIQGATELGKPRCKGQHVGSQWCPQERATRVRVCNCAKIEKRRNFPPVLKIVTCTVQAA